MRLITVVAAGWFYLFCIPTFGQTFNLDQLISLTKRDSAAVSSFVTEKDWVVDEFKLPTANKAGRITWKHSALEQSDDFAQFWLVYYYIQGKCRSLVYSTLDKETYESLKSQVASKHMRKIGTVNLANSSQTKYKWGIFTVTLEFKKNNLDQDNKPIMSYGITIDTI